MVMVHFSGAPNSSPARWCLHSTLQCSGWQSLISRQAATGRIRVKTPTRFEGRTSPRRIPIRRGSAGSRSDRPAGRNSGAERAPKPRGV